MMVNADRAISVPPTPADAQRMSAFVKGVDHKNMGNVHVLCSR